MGKASKPKRRWKPPVDSPERARLRVVQAEVATIQRKLRERFHDGLTRQRQPTRQELAEAQLLVDLLASRTWEGLEITMVLDGEVPTGSQCYQSAETGEWAKVRLLASGLFHFEGFDQATGRGVLAELESWQQLARWEPCSAREYGDQVQKQLDGNGMTWELSNMQKAAPLHPID